MLGSWVSVLEVDCDRNFFFRTGAKLLMPRWNILPLSILMTLWDLVRVETGSM